MRNQGKRNFRKVISLFSAILISLNNSFVPLAFAEEASESAEPSPSIVNESDTTVEATASASANTGGNEASDNGNDVDIDTGKAKSNVTGENEVNVNLSGSGSFESQTIIGTHEGDITVSAGTPGDFSGEGVDSEDVATLTNDVSSIATSGENAASDNEGDVSLETGNANASANLFNLVNFNVTGSGWRVFLVNIFGVLKGDIIIDPKLLSDIKKNVSGSYSLIVVENESSAYIVNNVEVLADTGSNDASGNGGMVKIETGQAQSVSKILDLINTNIYGENFFFLLVNNLGEWVGKVVEVDCKESECPKDSLTVYQWGFAGECKENCPESFWVSNNSDAVVTNNVFVFAGSGGNSISNTGGNVWLSTGDASASLRIIDIINSNITGRNFFFGLINNFGRWFGNLVFGACGGVEPQPEPQGEPAPEGPSLVVVKENSAGGAAINGGRQLTFKISVKNYGKAMARNVTLYDKLYDPNKNELTNQSWYLGEILPGEEVVVEYTIYLSADAPLGMYENKASAEGSDLGGLDVDGGEASSVFSVIAGGVALASSGPLGANVTSDILGAKATPETGFFAWQLFAAASLLVCAGSLLRKSSRYFFPLAYV